MSAETVEIFVQVVGDGIPVYQPVQAVPLANDVFRIESPKEDPDKEWRFATGSVVRCERRWFPDGEFGLLAVQAVEAP